VQADKLRRWIAIASSLPAVTITLMVDTAHSPPRAYVLKGERVGFKTLLKSDVALVTPWFSDLEFVTCLTARGLPMSVANEEEWFEKKTKNTDQSVQFAIFELENDCHIGNCGLFNFTPHNTACFGIGIGDREAWGKGYGSEATRLMAEFAFFFLNLFNIRLYVYGFNERAVRSYLSAGYREVGRIRGAVCIAGRRYDEIVMDITADDVDLSRMRTMVPMLAETNLTERPK
jgi:RimJ/RimL family protein N-acetyltransferase